MNAVDGRRFANQYTLGGGLSVAGVDYEAIPAALERVDGDEI
jgi:hypothetical protein